MRRNIHKFFIILFCSILFTGCGFHLRGYHSIPPQLKEIYISWGNPYDPLVLQLKQMLTSGGVVVESSPHLASVTMTILDARFSRQIAAISANTQVRTYQIQYHVSFELLNKNDKVIYGPVSVTAQSNYSVNANQLLGDNNLLDIQKETMIREAIGLIFNRLNSDQARRALHNEQ